MSICCICVWQDCMYLNFFNPLSVCVCACSLCFCVCVCMLMCVGAHAHAGIFLTGVNGSYPFIHTKCLWGLFWAEAHPISKLCGNPHSSFCVITLTNQSTNQHRNQLTQVTIVEISAIDGYYSIHYSPL